MLDLSFYCGKRVLLTGHTGFKGAWMSTVLINAGAQVTGYSTCSKKDTRLFDLCRLEEKLIHIKGDVRDLAHLLAVCHEFEPEIVIHMAAQPIVRESYRDPVNTYSTNVMGTVNILEAVRHTPSVRSFLNVTTDKVYRNREWEWGYRENEELDGFDPYSNSKSCSELVTHSYKNSFFQDGITAISTARAGNVIGGGDFASDRIIPDCIRAVAEKKTIIVRNPYSTRPYQHVLEPVMAYLMIAAKQAEDPALQGWYNIGPDDCDCVSTGTLVSLFCEKWGGDAVWKNVPEQNAPHESNFLKLDNTKFKNTFSWQPRWHIDEAVERVCDWTRVWLENGNISEEMRREIEAYVCRSKTHGKI